MNSGCEMFEIPEKTRKGGRKLGNWGSCSFLLTFKNPSDFQIGEIFVEVESAGRLKRTVWQPRSWGKFQLIFLAAGHDPPGDFSCW